MSSITLSAHDNRVTEPGASPVPGAPGTFITPVPAGRLLRSKKAYTTRFLSSRLDVSAEGFGLLTGPGVAPRAGDVVLARVVKIGQHPRLESPHSRRMALYVGDEIVIAYGNRYAPDQFLAVVPKDLGICHLAAGGGMASGVLDQHARMGHATLIEPLGLLVDDAGVLNLRRLAPQGLGPGPVPAGRPPVIAVLGTSMNSGKSTALASLIRGLTAAGLDVSAGKVTGTGSGNDPLSFADAGASRVLDFTDFGFPSTFMLEMETVRSLLSGIISALTSPANDVVVLEIADGLYQAETRQLLADPMFHSLVDHVIFAATDALGAWAGVDLLRGAGVKVAAVTGLVTSSPLATGEAAAVLDLPVVDTSKLTDSATAIGLLPVRCAGGVRQ